jgi:hypothetical protein
MRPTDVGEGGWRTRVAERSQYRPHPLSDHHLEKQLAAVKGSGRDARTNSVCAGPVARSIGLHCSGLHGFRRGLDASFGGRSSELTRQGNTRAGAVFEEDRGCPTDARNVSVERRPQQRPWLAASPNRARTGIEASPTTHPNGGKGCRNTHNCPTTLGADPGSSRSQPRLWRREAAFPPPHIREGCFVLLGCNPALPFAFATCWPAQDRAGHRFRGGCQGLVAASPPDSPIGPQRTGRRLGTACQAAQEPPRQLPGSTCQV